MKNKDKEKHKYSGYEIVFGGKGLWHFNYGFARNVIIFGVDNSLSSHIDNFKKWVLNFKWRRYYWY